MTGSHYYPEQQYIGIEKRYGIYRDIVKKFDISSGCYLVETYEEGEFVEGNILNSRELQEYLETP